MNKHPENPEIPFAGEPPPDEPPDPIVGGQGIDRLKGKIKIFAPESGQVFQPNAAGEVSIAVHGTITIWEANPDGGYRKEALPEEAHQWVVDEDSVAAVTGQQGTIKRRLAPESHSIALRVGERGSKKEVKIIVEAPPRRSFWQRILDFFRRLFGHGS